MEEVADGGLEGGRIGQTCGGVGLKKLAGDLAEVGHIGTEENRFADCGGFDGGLSTVMGREGFADKRDVGQFGEGA